VPVKKLLVRVPHAELNLADLIKHLEEDLVSVFFRKETNGQYRTIYPFTRNPKHIPLSEHKRLEGVVTTTPNLSDVQKNKGVLVKAYSVIDMGWRSLYTNNLMHYEVYDQEGDTL